jgi:Mg2+ and Co2+ transporter CorA
VISGIFGMNVRVPAQGIDNLLPFSMILSVIFVASIIFLLSFKQIGWL